MRVLKFGALLLAGLLVMGACDDDEPTLPDATGPFQLTFQGDASFQGPHAGQMIYVAVVRTSDGAVVARQNGTVSATADPAFSFTFTSLLAAGTAYQVHYWIDSNFGGGTAGVCDPKANDHQWNVAVPAPTEDVTVSESHDAAITMDVCTTFAANLTFAGDASFQGPHGGQNVYVAVIRADNGTVVARQTGTVSSTADPAFSFSFTGLAVVDVAYQVHYWIDSNFGGGTAGACDPKAIDHQWNVAIPAVTGGVTQTESHDASMTMDVCSTFTANLTFAGDASFQGPHGGHSIYVAVLRAADGAVVARQNGTVSGTADPAFSFSFAGLLVVGEAYQVHYWIDSNFGGGTAGVCDPRANDHQWNVAIPAVTGAVTQTESHDAAMTMDVCPTFTANLTFAGDASFQGPHGGQTVYVAVLRADNGAVVARQTGTVSATVDPAFSFSFAGLLVTGVAYQVHYWIDSNFGGGTAGACDPRANDHQWSVDVATVDADVSVTEPHDPGMTMDVCSTFTANLTFAGDAGFQGPHGGQMISVGVVRADNGAVVARQTGTVSATMDPAFSFSFAGLLVVGVAYQVHYWIDSNFGGGTAGVCDAPATDHQWSVDVATVDADVSITEPHNPATVTDVCGTFP